MSTAIESRDAESREAFRPAAECRIWRRHQCRLLSRFAPVSGPGLNEEHWFGTICNISPGGLGLVSDHRFEPGSGLVVELAPDDDCSMQVYVRVVHATAQDDGRWLMGCAFASPLREEDFLDLLPRLQSARAVSRSSDRQASAANGGVAIWWQDVNSGVRRKMVRPALPPSWPPSPGKVLRMLFPGATTPARMIVHTCDRDGQAWLVRFSFVGTPPENVARLFQPRLAAT